MKDTSGRNFGLAIFAGLGLFGWFVYNLITYGLSFAQRMLTQVIWAAPIVGIFALGVSHFWFFFDSNKKGLVLVLILDAVILTNYFGIWTISGVLRALFN